MRTHTRISHLHRPSRWSSILQSIRSWEWAHQLHPLNIMLAVIVSTDTVRDAP